MKYENEKKETKNNGFTLIEVLVSLILIALTLVSAARIISFALDAYRKSVIRFTMVQEMENCRNELLAKPFDSIDLADGEYTKQDGKIILNWHIESLSPEIKRVRLSVSYKVHKKKIYFYIVPDREVLKSFIHHVFSHIYLVEN